MSQFDCFSPFDTIVLLYQPSGMVLQVREEFRAITGCDRNLSSEWMRHRMAVLAIAETNPVCRELLEEITDDLNEGICS